MHRDAIQVTADQLEDFAFESGVEIRRHGDHDEARIGSRLFVVPIPAQRTPGDES